jgi:hypothetical protein
MTTTRKRIMSAAAELGRLGGSKNTAAQQDARKRNAQTAGRPARVCNFCGERVGGHKHRPLDETCGAHGWRWQQPHAEGGVALLNPYDVLDDVISAYDDGRLIVSDVDNRAVEFLMTAVRTAAHQRAGRPSKRRAKA